MSHSPKLYALEALEDGRLSKAGKRRIEAHLAACDECTRALTGVRRYRVMLTAAREEAPPELGWDALERKLDRERKPQTGKLVALAFPLLAIAATVAIGWIGLSGQQRENERAAREAASKVDVPRAEPAPQLLEGWVGALAGAPQQSGAVLTLASRVHEGDVLRTATNEALHVRLSAKTGIALWQDSELRVVRLREREIVLDLVRGGVSNEVLKLAEGATYRVRTGDVVASVRGTRFAVAKTATAASVSVHEGLVAVSRNEVELAVLHPGQTWSSEDADAVPLDERKVSGLDVASSTWPVLTLPVLPNVRSWMIDTASFSGNAQVAMRVPPGELTLLFDDSRGAPHSVVKTITSEGLTLTEEEISRLIERDRGDRFGTLDPQLITPVVRAGLDGLKRCYEQSLRRSPQLAGKLTLTLRVSSRGQVMHTKLSTQAGEQVDVGLTGCITGKAATWTFPAPTGGPVIIDLPLNLKSNSP